MCGKACQRCRLCKVKNMNLLDQQFASPKQMPSGFKHCDRVQAPSLHYTFQAANKTLQTARLQALTAHCTPHTANFT